MKRTLLLWLLLTIFAAAKADPISELLTRVLPARGDAARFVCARTGGATPQFTIACDGKRVEVTGSDNTAIAAGINWYLQHYAGISISWSCPTAKLPARLPKCAPETHRASVDWRYYLNFCTLSYSMAFWDWDRWQQELDWMALHGINMPLAITGMECVWRRVLEGYGYASLSDVNSFVCGSGYYAWFFMNNLTAWGGPQPEHWYQRQQQLAQRIFSRMAELDMHPVVPGYVGMVPRDFLSKASADAVRGWQAADVVDGGQWNRFARPAFVNNTERLKEFGTRYYAAFQQLYGHCCPTHFYAIDPFHEGGVPRGVTSAEASITAMWEALTAFDPQAVWVAQHWQQNPLAQLTQSIPRGRLIILDLHGDEQADTVCGGNHTAADGTPHDWVWGQVSNFGGNVGLFGRMDNLIRGFYGARRNKASNRLVGIGALPEGIENNAMLYDLLYALPWTNTDYTRPSWLADYVQMRYGLRPTDKAYGPMLAAWQRLGAGIYNCPEPRQQGTTESVLMMRPSLTPRTVSSWAHSSWYWDMAELRTALAEMLSVSKALKRNENYRYDIVDVTRQALADYGKTLLDQIRERRDQRDMDRFLQLILDQDRLVGTRAELRLGRWTEAARALGSSASEQDLYEWNARMLLTTWGEEAQCDGGRLHDYANREWQGLLAAYYYPRWKAFFQNGCTDQPWFERYEWPFVQGQTVPYHTFTARPEGDELSVARELFDKYLKTK